MAALKMLLQLFCLWTSMNVSIHAHQLFGYEAQEYEDLLEPQSKYNTLNQFCYTGTIPRTVLRYGEHYDEDCRCHTFGSYNDTYHDNFLSCNHIILNTSEHLDINPKESNFKYIIFTDSMIPVVSVGAFMSYTNLTELYLNKSSIQSIHPGAFTGLTNLKELYLQNNNISAISKGIFNSLPKLEILTLSNNNLELIEPNAFLGLFSINYLNLSKNALKELQRDAFYKLPLLQTVDLSDNLLTDLPIALFIDTVINDLRLSYNNLTSISYLHLPHSIEYLRLDHNYISNVTILSSTPFLREIDLSSNNISKIEALPKNLIKLNINNNQIKTFHWSLFNKSEMLETIDFGNNLLSNLTEDSFSNVPKLTNLYLQRNQINNIPIGCFRNLQYLWLLNLSGNAIEELEYGTFNGLDNLRNLDISNNKLYYLYESSFHNLKNLNTLNIAGNMISSFDPHDLLDYSENLHTLSLDNNPWYCKSLLTVVHEFEKRHVVILKGSVEKFKNIHGISCLHNKLDFNNNNYSPSRKENTSLEHFNKLSLELNSLKNFFGREFHNSTFYKFFENYRNPENQTYSNNENSLKLFNDVFENTTFYKLLNGKALINNLDSLKESILQLSKELKSVDVNIKKLHIPDSVSVNMTQEFCKYLQNYFKNSSFYKYFDEDFTDSKFVRYFNKTFPEKIDSGFSNYFNFDIQNSSFYKLLNNHSWNDLNTHFSNFNTEAHFSHLMDNSDSLNNAKLLAKIVDLTDNIKVQQVIMQSAKTGTTIFMVIIIILLMVITLLFAFNYFKINIKENLNKSYVKKSIESNTNTSDVEVEML